MIWKQCKTCLKSLQSTPSFDWLAQPTNTTEPTKQCVVLTGTPILVANRTVNAAPSSIVKPLEVKQVNYISHAWNISTNRVGNWWFACIWCWSSASTYTMLLHYAHAPCFFITQCTMLVHYAVHHATSLRSAPCCFIRHMHHAAWIRSAPCCLIMQSTLLLHYAHGLCCFITHCTMLLHYAVHHATSLRSAPCFFIRHMHHAAWICSAPCCFIMHMHQKKKPSDFSDTRNIHKHTTYNKEGHRMYRTPYLM